MRRLLAQPPVQAPRGTTDGRATLADASADPKNMSQLMSSASYTAQDWVHLLIWDYAFGRIIWMDALKKDVPMRHRSASPSLPGALDRQPHLMRTRAAASFCASSEVRVPTHAAGLAAGAACRVSPLRACAGPIGLLSHYATCAVVDRLRPGGVQRNQLIDDVRL